MMGSASMENKNFSQAKWCFIHQQKEFEKREAIIQPKTVAFWLDGFCRTRSWESQKRDQFITDPFVSQCGFVL